MAQRIDDAMVDVINKMNDITEHLRAHEFVESANRIARNVHEVINIFTNAVIKFNDDQMIMHQANQVAPRAEPSAPKQVANKNGQSLMLYSDVARQAPGAMSGSSSAQATSSGTVKAVVGALGLTATIPSQINPVVPVGHPPILDVAEEKAAMLTISGVFGPHSLNFLTSKIREGPLFSVEINYAQNFAEITFQKSAHAVAFLGQERSKRARTGSGLFGGSYKIVSAAEFAWDKEIRKMEAKPRERRRLTFARGGLLGGNLTVKKILNDMGQLVGAEAIEFVWAFNTGNVTAVFKSVATARTVRDHFLDLAIHKSNPYYDVQVTFSTDPCEKQLNLESQIGVPQHRRNRGRRAGA
ncbi:hypothetical protein D8B26_003895 [Coccidioides posadasii str. Silveira]|uniref:Uncharacterized protein n=2 Tax=Coccidioides posadasii TaxID=199306 RepID=E9D9A2_COCPS|nr:hypothetical protein CPC735_072280 [Coccidioides posadasii C735 delta SOWgp]EER29546.1 hypothetical protein CPC735_072280 [Coccidioides posadasii C735 delta SOWgp]EFW17136.1 conserved hypothetical protein [Coccidioides posadasii str. Silveira]QVM09231.1 hypothetical protein D8B26_003895 [Coccidioides posadasii str. Silveira]|eukprot:XP_003071691.1 hypothetical protein CPC735_072280 [Coccidioides posadasii C735 delta SOWgp]